MADNQFRMKVIALLALGMFLLSGCGSGPNQINEAPPLPPTATPAPRPGLDGELLAPLASGEEVAAPDHRYSLDIPDGWTKLNNPEGDLDIQAAGDLTYAISRSPMPDGVDGVQAWAEQVREGTEAGETVSFEPVQVGGIQAVRWVYRATVDSEERVVHAVFLVDGDTGFTLTGTAPAIDAEAALVLFDSVAGSFSFPRG